MLNFPELVNPPVPLAYIPTELSEFVTFISATELKASSDFTYIAVLFFPPDISSLLAAFFIFTFPSFTNTKVLLFPFTDFTSTNPFPEGAAAFVPPNSNAFVSVVFTYIPVELLPFRVSLIIDGLVLAKKVVCLLPAPLLSISVPPSS